VRERYDEVMTRLVITLPAVTATQILACLDAHVARLHAAGDPWTLAQLRVDVLTALVLGDLDPYPDPDVEADADPDSDGDVDPDGEGLGCPDLGGEGVSVGLREWFARTYDPDSDLDPVPDVEDEVTGLSVAPVTGEVHDPVTGLSVAPVTGEVRDAITTTPAPPPAANPPAASPPADVPAAAHRPGRRRRRQG